MYITNLAISQTTQVDKINHHNNPTIYQERQSENPNTYKDLKMF
jgi:hypothetical protein